MKKLSILLILLSFLTSCQESNETKQTNKVEAEKQEVKKTFDENAYKKRGKGIAMATFKVFKGHITKIAGKEGLPAVVGFCNEQAMKLTDSMAKVHNVEMKRVSHKLRNQKNAANATQKSVIDNYLALQENHKQLKPVVVKEDDGFVHFYAPIKIKQECLKCHGQLEKDIKPELYNVIKAKYPNDKAINFREGELRGIWDIKFLDKP